VMHAEDVKQECVSRYFEGVYGRIDHVGSGRFYFL
jgi:hypothetical protein